MKRIVEILQKTSQYACDEDVVLYGLHGIISGLVSVILLSVLSVLTHSFRELLVFLPIHMIGVRFTGGYHAKTSVRCQGLTLLSFLMVYALTRVILLYADEKWICLVGGIFSIYIFFAAPVLNIRKPMTNEDIRVNRSKARWFVVLLMVMLLCSVFVITSKWMAATLLANSLEISIFMFLGKEAYLYEKAKSCRNDIETCRAFCKFKS